MHRPPHPTSTHPASTATATTASPAPNLPPLTVDFLDPADIPAAAAMMSAAWLTDSMCHWIYQDVPLPALEAAHVTFLETLPRNIKILIAKRGAGLAGFTKLEYPVFPGEPAIEAVPKTFPEGSRLEEVSAFRELYKHTETDEGPKFVLSGLATHPDFRRQGVAAAMLAAVTTEVDLLGLPCFLFSSAAAVPAYVKAGWVTLGPAYRGGPDGEWSSTPMRRPPQPLRIEAASVADAPAFGRVHVPAFAEEEFNKRVFAGVAEADLIEHFASEHAEVLDPAMGRVAFKAVRGTTLLGFITLISPSSPSDAPRPWRADKWPPGAHPELVAEWFSRMDLQLDQIERHWYVEYLAVDPRAQRQGVGKALIAKGLELADAGGLATYLKASAAGRGLYERFGFGGFGEPIVGGQEGEFVLCPMRRAGKATV